MNEAGSAKKDFLFGFDFELREGLFIENPLRQQTVLFDFNGIGNATETISAHTPFTFEAEPESFSQYAQRFECVKKGLFHGDSFLTNLTVTTPITSSLSLETIYKRSHALYRLYVPERFVCFSPERFVCIRQGKIYAFPMKGTIDATLPDAENIILNDYKEKAEHYTIVDLIRNDLNRISEKVKVNRFRYIDKLITHKGAILQVSSEIEGTLPIDYNAHIGTLIFDLLPAGSVSGAPKQATLQLIRQAEQTPRGFYTGVAGYFDGENLDACVLIRYIEQTNNRLYFRSGGGITVNSHCAHEYREAIQKVYVSF